MMRLKRRTNLLLGLVFVATAVVLLLRALNLVPDGLFDLITRGWPALLVLLGLSVFLRERVPFGSLIALVVCGLLVGGLASSAYSARSRQERTDYQENVAQPIGDKISLLHVQVVTLDSDVELVRTLSGSSVTGQFIGSTESKLTSEYTEAPDSTATLTISEMHPSQFPMLGAVGRGRLRLELPAGIAMDVAFKGSNGDVSLNLSGLSLERLNVDLQKGTVLVTLPEYKPLGSSPDASLGALAVREGNISVFVPTTVAAHFDLDTGARPQFDPTVYNLLDVGTGRALESRLFDAASVKLRYTIIAPRGEISVAAAGQ
jgi:hypothetical protein